MGQDDLMPRDPAVANPLLGETVGSMLAAMAAPVPDGEAIVATDRRITYRALYAEARRFARAPGAGNQEITVWNAVDAMAVAVLVLQAFVIGVPDARTNEAAVAYVIPRPGVDLDGEDVIAHCKGRIASFKVPRHVRIVADVPRTPGPHGDKVQKTKLRERFLAETVRPSDSRSCPLAPG